MKDNWCRTYVMPDGTRVSGSAAREARIKAAGGMDNICREIGKDAGEFAARKSFDMAMRLAHAAPANDNVVSIRRVRRTRSA